ncbi:MAG: CHAT domain-containing protein, partial [Symploca sp. SIO1A3]|nr:CHAT domain-containing protein [Symploca sp. SIO1A3]
PVEDYLPWRCVNPSEAGKISEYQEASLRYQEAIDKLSPSSAPRIKAQLNLLSLALESGDILTAQALGSEKINLAHLPHNRTKVYLQISLAKSLACLNSQSATEEASWQSIRELLVTAHQEAEELHDKRVKSYALGNLAGLYEYFGWLDEQLQQQKYAQQWRQEALKLTHHALYLAQQSEAWDIAYKWHWQLGRLWQAQGNKQKAIAHYNGAVKALQTLRQDLVVLHQDIQFSFREQVEPIYRKLVDLLLQPNGEAEVSQANLKRAREVIEALQLAELDNFFREACLDAKPQQIEDIDPTAAVIYTIILDQRLEVILSLPGQDLVHDTATLPENFSGKIEALRKSLIDDLIPTAELQGYSQQVYGWLFPAKIQSQLQAAKLVETNDIPTLVFILDSELRNIPMAALYDGQEYLVEKYATAIAPSLQLLDPKAFELEPLMLMAGLSEKAPSFDTTASTWRELKNVGKELSEIAKVISKNRLLQDSEFIVSNLENELSRSPFTIVHLATHGQFSSNLEETYILDWNHPIYINQLNQLLRTSEIKTPAPIELLVLSACQTAEGDKRAALGLAGIAVRAGARSTLATLWSVNDKSTAEFMSQFYTELVKPKMTRAKALSLVQRSFLQQPKDDSYQHPKHWAAFILVGNWM